MFKLLILFLALLWILPPASAQDPRQLYSEQRRRAFGSADPSRNYSSPYQNQNSGFQQFPRDPIYQGHFRLLGNVQVDKELMKTWDAARDAHFILDQVSSNMSSCMQMDEKDERLQDDFKILESSRTGQAAASRYKQIESIVRQAKAEFDAYQANLTGGHDANNPHVKNGNELLKQARKMLDGTTPFLNKLADAAQGIAGAAAELANMVRQLSGNNTVVNRTPPVAPPFNRIQPVNTTPSNGSGNNKPTDPNNSQNPPSGSNPPSAGTFAKPDHPNLDEKLKKFGEALTKRALDSVTDPAERAKIAYNLKEKFDGVGEGLNEAKEEVKQAASSAFNAAVQATEAFKNDPVGTMNAAAEAATKFGEAFAKATESAIDAASKDSQLFDTLLKNAIANAAESVANYSNLPPKQQGKILGKAIFWSVNPGGSLEGAQLAGQAFNRAGNVLKPHANQLAAELKELYSIGKGKLAAAKNKLAQSASRWGNQPQLAPAGAYSGPTSTAWKQALPEEDPFKLFMQADSQGLKAGTKIGNVVVDDGPLAGGIFDGQKVSDGIKWPKGWRKPKAGSFLSSKGKLYFKPNEQFRQQLGLGPDDLIPYTEKGVPDLLKWTRDGVNHRYQGTLTGFSTQDTNLIASKLASENWRGLKTQAEVLREFERMDVTVHHFDILPDGTNVLQLVDRRIHAGIRHTGTSKILRGGL